MNTNISGSEALIKSLLKEGVDTIFGYPGGAIIFLYVMNRQLPMLRKVMPELMENPE